MFPDMVYRVPGLHREQNGGTFSYLGVDDQAALDAALADGWSLTIGEAIAAGSANPAVELAEALGAAIEILTVEDRDALEEKAKALGVSFNKRTSDEVLIERIAAA